MTQQVTMRELLRDKIFRKWMTRKPEFPNPGNVRWRVYVQRQEGGPWAKKDVESYAEGYKLVAQNFKRWHDCALVCLGRESRPPVVRKPVKVRNAEGKLVKGYKRTYHQAIIRVPGHHWCGYCRRPTVFRNFSKHHALPSKFNSMLLSWEPRCTVCGIRLAAIKRH